MKTIQSYLRGIRENPAKGWRVVYTDILGKPLTDTEKFLSGVRVFGEEAMFEAVITTSTKKLNTGDPLNYVLAVARQIWKDELQSSITKDAEAIRLERSLRRMAEDNADLALKIEEAKRRVDADNPLQ